jgi:predicted alpha/beta hydrolase
VTEDPTSAESDRVDERPVRIATDDGLQLAGTWFLPVASAPAPSTAIVVACGAGIPARFYTRLAQYLAGRGAAVLTFDYRGIGASRAGRLRGFDAGMDVWAKYDFSAAVATAHAAYPGLPLAAVAHSVGTLYVGGAADSARLSRLVFLAPHTGYWRDYGRRWRWLLYLTWHVFMPAVTRRVGYFPGRALGLGEDLPKQAALDWAGRRQPEVAHTPDEVARFGPGLARYHETRAETLALSISDDAFAPPAAAQRLLANYPSLHVVHETVTPASLGLRRLGHFGFLRRPAGEFFWERIADWVIQDAANAREVSSPVPSD